jgi:hypothetical protein
MPKSREPGILTNLRPKTIERRVFRDLPELAPKFSHCLEGTARAVLCNPFGNLIQILLDAR